MNEGTASTSASAGVDLRDKETMRNILAEFFLKHAKPEQLLRLDSILSAYGDDFLALHNDLMSKYGEGILDTSRTFCLGCGGCEFVRFNPSTQKKKEREQREREEEKRQDSAKQTNSQRQAQKDIMRLMSERTAASSGTDMVPRLAKAEVVDSMSFL